MKECPECGSVLADNEPYCENCGYDPDFDGGGWRHGSAGHQKKTYGPREPIKDPDPYVFGEVIDSAFCLGSIILLVFATLVYFVWS